MQDDFIYGTATFDGFYRPNWSANVKVMWILPTNVHTKVLCLPTIVDLIQQIIAVIFLVVYSCVDYIMKDVIFCEIYK